MKILTQNGDLLASVLKVNSMRSRTKSSSQDIKAGLVFISDGQKRRTKKTNAKQKARSEAMKRRKEINSTQVSALISDIDPNTLDTSNLTENTTENISTPSVEV